MNDAIFNILFSLTEAIGIVAYVAFVWPSQAPVNEQLCLYFLFVAVFFVLFGFVRKFTGSKRHKPEEWRRWNIFLCIEIILTFFLLSALFKLIIYDRWPQVAQNTYHTLLALLLINKIFHRSIINFLENVYAFVQAERNRLLLTKVAVGGSIALIILLLYLPDPLGVVARVFVGEQFHNWDTVYFAPAYAYSKGLILDVDVISHYGLGMPIMMYYLTKLMGGLSYVHLLIVLMWLSIIYYIGWFLLLRRWIGGVLIPMATILFGIRTQLFRPGAYPITFTYPSGTPLRFFLDVVVFFLLWRHIKTRRDIFLYVSSLCCGFMLFYMSAEGLYLTGAFYLYLLMRLSTRFMKQQPEIMPWSISIHFFLVPLITFVFIFLAQGQYIFSPIFWQNMGEFRDYFFSGFAIGPMDGSLKSGNFLESLMGYIVPIVYMLTLLVAGTFWYLRRGVNFDKYLLAVIIAFQGLGLYHYYALTGYPGSYYMLGLPYNILLGFWVNEGLILMYDARRRLVALGLMVVCLWALLTNYNFISYPNLMNLSRNPLVDTSVVQFPVGRATYFNHLFREYPESGKFPLNSLGESDEKLKFEKDFISDEDLKAYYLEENDFSIDAKLIQKWTTPDMPVPLISSFEVEMLQQADRKPFFYYFEMLNSRPLRMRMFHDVLFYTHQQLARTTGSLEQRKPQYLFMERIFLNNKVPASYFYDIPGMIDLLEYVDEHYEPIDTGFYLVAMKRK